MENSFEVGDKVYPILLVNAYGKEMKSIGKEAVIMKLIDDKAVLIVNGQIWGTFHLSNLRHI